MTQHRHDFDAACTHMSTPISEIFPASAASGSSHRISEGNSAKEINGVSLLTPQGKSQTRNGPNLEPADRKLSEKPAERRTLGEAAVAVDMAEAADMEVAATIIMGEAVAMVVGMAVVAEVAVEATTIGTIMGMYQG